ncbi:MAG: MFS transporter [archaeon]|nr:MFS transporter [archaeon]MCR4323382.1 MFS transporter [Nanoarchaeota archaeon]
MKKVITAEHPIVAKKIDKSLNLSLKEGSINSSATAVGLSYFSPFAIAMNATASQVGILGAIINLLPSLVQLKAANLLRYFSRKKIVRVMELCRILLWIPMILTGYLFYIGIPHMVWILIALVGIYYSLFSVSQMAWFSWMGSLVQEERRGKYFSKRNGMAGFFGLLTIVIGAIILDGFKKLGESQGDLLGYTLLGFGLLFVMSSILKIWGRSLISKQYEPKIIVRKKDYFSLKQFLSTCTSTPFGRFTIFRGVFSLAIGIATPFWTVYMLRNLGFSYVWFTAIVVSGTAFQLLFLPLLGKASDKFGNIKIMKICSWIMFTTPIAWLLSALITNPTAVKIYLLIVPGITGGFAWAGYNLSANNYIYDSVSQRKRSYGLSYLNLFVGVGMFLGSLIGSLLVSLNISFMSSILFVFLVSAILRLLVALVGLRYLTEVRHVKKFSSHYMIREFVPMQGIVREVHHLEHLVQKVEHNTQR